MIENISNLSSILNEPPFIKSFPILRYAGLTPGQIKIIEYILSFQYDGKPCYPYQETIATMCKLRESSVRTMICVLSDDELILTVTKKNFNRKTGKGGSRTTYVVNVDLIEAKIRSNPEFIQAAEEASEDYIPEPQPKKRNNKKSTTPKAKAPLIKEIHIRPAIEGIPVTTPKLPSEKMSKVVNDGADNDCATGTCSTQDENGDKKTVQLSEMKPVLNALKLYLLSKGEDIFYDLDEISKDTGYDEYEIRESLNYLVQKEVILKDEKYIFVKPFGFKDFYLEPFQVVKPNEGKEESLPREYCIDELTVTFDDSEPAMNHEFEALFNKQELADREQAPDESTE